MELSLGDFVKYLILLLHRNGVIFQLSKYKPWHLLFYKLKKSPEMVGKPAFFNNLQFNWDSEYPELPELAEFLHVLCVTGSVVTTSPCFEVYHLPDEMAELWSKKFEALEEESKQFLNTALTLAQE